VAVVVGGIAAVSPAAGFDATTLTVGSISLTPKEEVATFQPLADYLAAQLRPLGVQRGRVVVVQTMDQMVQAIKSGEVTVYIDSPFPALYVSDRSGAKPTLRRWKRGRADYQSVIFVRKDSGIGRLSDLVERVIAFEEPYSTTGYFLPKASLLRLGVRLSALPDRNAPLPIGMAGYVFSNDDETTMFWVLERRVAAGALDDQNFDRLAGERAGELQIIYRSIIVPRHVVVLPSALNPRWTTAIKETLTNMHLTEEGQAVLRKFQRTTKFDRFPQGPDAALRPLRDLMRSLTNLGE